MTNQVQHNNDNCTFLFDNKMVGNVIAKYIPAFFFVHLKNFELNKNVIKNKTKLVKQLDWKPIIDELIKQECWLDFLHEFLHHMQNIYTVAGFIYTDSIVMTTEFVKYSIYSSKELHLPIYFPIRKWFQKNFIENNVSHKDKKNSLYDEHKKNLEYFYNRINQNLSFIIYGIPLNIEEHDNFIRKYKSKKININDKLKLFITSDKISILTQKKIFKDDIFISSLGSSDINEAMAKVTDLWWAINDEVKVYSILNDKSSKMVNLNDKETYISQYKYYIIFFLFNHLFRFQRNKKHKNLRTFIALCEISLNIANRNSSPAINFILLTIMLAKNSNEIPEVENNMIEFCNKLVQLLINSGSLDYYSSHGTPIDSYKDVIKLVFIDNIKFNIKQSKEIQSDLLDHINYYYEISSNYFNEAINERCNYLPIYNIIFFSKTENLINSIIENIHGLSLVDKTGEILYIVKDIKKPIEINSYITQINIYNNLFYNKSTKCWASEDASYNICTKKKGKHCIWPFTNPNFSSHDCQVVKFYNMLEKILY